MSPLRCAVFLEMRGILRIPQPRCRVVSLLAFVMIRVCGPDKARIGPAMIPFVAPSAVMHPLVLATPHDERNPCRPRRAIMHVSKGT